VLLQAQRTREVIAKRLGGFVKPTKVVFPEEDTKYGFGANLRWDQC
jgi:hypothetical protein